jgi:retron-type reverse transcriptase
VLVYVERWLKAGVMQQDGIQKAALTGTPQGGVISPLFMPINLRKKLIFVFSFYIQS